MNMFAKAGVVLLTIGFLFLSGCRSMSPRSGPTIAPAPAPDFSSGASADHRPPPLISGEIPAAPLPGAPNGTSTAYLPPASPPESLPASGSSDPIPERFSAFRPIQNGVALPDPASVSKPDAVSGSPPDDAARNAFRHDLDKLQRRIAELEKNLAESEEKVRQSTRTAPTSVPPTESEPSPSETARSFLQAFSPDGAADSQTDSVSREELARPVPPVPLPAIDIPGVVVSSDGERVRIEIPDTVLFVSGTNQLSPEAEDALRRLVAEIRVNYPEASLEIEGHTDCIVRDPTNTTQKHDAASHKSLIVLQYFVQTLRWDSGKIKSSSFGPSRPVADNGTPDGRARNNRIEIVVSP